MIRRSIAIEISRKGQAGSNLMDNFQQSSLREGSNITHNAYQIFPEPFCSDYFWDLSKTWYTDNPDFTQCFQQTVLAWIPCFLLWLTVPIQLYYTFYNPYSVERWTWISITKMILTMGLALLSVSEFFYFVDKWNTNTEANFAFVDLVTPWVKLMTYLLAASYVYMDKRSARPSSLVFLVFWLLSFIEHIVTLRSQIILNNETGASSSDADRLLFETIGFPLVVSQLILSCWAEYFPELLENGPNPSPEKLTSILGQSIHSFFDWMAYKGWRAALEQSDLWDLLRGDKTKTNVERFQKYWQKQLLSANKVPSSRAAPAPPNHPTSKQPSLTKALAKTFWKPMTAAFFLRLTHDIFTFSSPIILRWIIDFIRDKNKEVWKGYLYAGLLLLSATVQTFGLNLYFFVCSRTGLRLRGAIMAAVHRKSLKITSESKRSSNLGEIVNLMSVDAQRINDFMIYVHLLWSAPFLILVALYFLYNILGYAVFSGLGLLILTFPLNAWLANRNKVLQLAQMEYKDQRIKLTSEILSGMKILKLYAWEKSFEQQILDIREKEIEQLKKSAYLLTVSAFNWFITPFLVALFTFGTYVLISPDNVLDADKAFVGLALLNILRQPLTMLPSAVTLLIQSRVSIGRLTKFLCNDELSPDNVDNLPASREAQYSILIKNGNFAWARDEEPFLKNVGLSVKSGSLTAVVGQIGAGKSSLIASVLGLMEKKSGSVEIRGNLAYVPQQAWIQNMTVKNNILFGRPFDHERYEKVLDVCALRTDLELLSAGDETEIGERGANLSGGQRQRISLARAVYSDADVILLDDPLSAVDAHVGKHIFEQAIGPKGFLRGKTRILVTHGVTYLPQTDLIVVLDKGRLSEVGSYLQLLRNNGAFAEFLRLYFLEEHERDDEDEDPEVKSVKEDLQQRAGSVHSSKRPSITAIRRSSVESKIREAFNRTLSRVSSTKRGRETHKKSTSKVEEKVEQAGKLVEEETAEIGNVKWSVYDNYFKNSTYPVAGGMAFAYALYNALNIWSSFWLTSWTEDSGIPERNGTDWRDYRLGIYGLFGFLQGVTITVAYFLLAYGQIMASRNLHKGLLYRIMRAPMSFFDTTPLGRIVNRFSKDVEIVDTVIPMNIEGIVYCLLAVVATLMVISISTPIFAPVIIPLAIFYFMIQRFYIPSSRQLKRLEAVSRSPIYSHFQESVSGSSVILATRQGDRFIVENEQRVDANNMSFYLNIVSNRWVAIRMDFVGNLVTFFSALFAVLSREKGTISAEEAGLSISYALSVTQVMNWMIRNVSDMESNIVSVERIKQYSEVENEAPWVIESTRPPKDWPTDGGVNFNDYQTRYRKELDLVLRGVNCKIRGGEKIGIVGRTGAGKSSLTLAVFRLIEASGGSITIDGLDISNFGLHDIRSRITILPQEPVLFSGTMRMNLDPFGQYTDEEIWRALTNAHLKPYVEALPQGLSHLVAEGGENLSVGQRQLVCLARALLRKTKILVLDEATAAIDLETDALIQNTIRTNFAECTVLTIAHRLNTVMDSTRVMVLDQGLVREFDSPSNLLENTDGIFYGMAKSANVV